MKTVEQVQLSVSCSMIYLLKGAPDGVSVADNVETSHIPDCSTLQTHTFMHTTLCHSTFIHTAYFLYKIGTPRCPSLWRTMKKSSVNSEDYFAFNLEPIYGLLTNMASVHMC